MTVGDLKLIAPTGELATQIGPADISIAAGVPVLDPGLETALLIALFTDRRANADDVLPHHTDTRGGWWGDPTLGSRLWLLRRSPLNAATLRRAQQYLEEAAQDQLVTPGVIKSIALTITATGNVMNIAATITAPDGITSSAYKFSLNWKAQI